MKCKNHPDRDAEYICASCGVHICNNCIEESKPGEYFCFQCAMLQSVSQGGTSLVDKRKRVSEKELEKKKREWGPFHYFVIAASALIVVMWGVILFGGKEAPGQKIDYAKNQRVFIFMVNSSIKRHAHYEGNKYPEKLFDLFPKYLRMRKEDLPELNRLSYKRDPKTGYRLSFSKPKPGEMNIVISPKGIKHEST
ncbi:B-box zinc finger protein [Thermodesulfobacteriota bacterium]